jgi:hypothetical protein
MTATPERLDAITARLDAATPGPWEAYDANEGEWPPRPMWCVANDAFHNPPEDEDAPWLAVEVHTGVKRDAEFIANAPADIAYLLTELQKRDDALAGVGALAKQYDSEADRLTVKAKGFIQGEVGSRYLGYAADTRMKASLIRAAVTAAMGDEG